MAQNTDEFILQGIVTEADTGQGMIGVTVTIKGTSAGTITDYAGHYNLGGLTSESVLVFNYIGFVPVEETVGNREIIDVTLKEDVVTLEDVVIFGENQKDIRMITGSVEKIDTKVFSAGTPSGSFDQLLQGQVAGLAVRANGEPGEKARIRIRGNNSFGQRTNDISTTLLANNRANEPLYVLNGVPISSDVFNTINPDDIVSINVLKDGLSTVEYGIRGANGVIEIKTKRGIAGKSRYNIRYQHTIRPIGGLGGISLMGTDEKLELERKLNIVSGKGFILRIRENDSEEEIAIKTKRLNKLRETNTDWLSELSRLGEIKDLQMSFSGGSDKTQYYISGSYYNEQGTYQNSWSQRLTTQFNIDHQLRPNLTLAFIGNIGNNSRSSAKVPPSKLIYTLQPYESPESSTFTTRIPGESANFSNPFDELLNNYNTTDAWRTDLNVKLNWVILTGLNTSLRVGVTYTNRDVESVSLPNPDSPVDKQQQGSYQLSQAKLLTNRLTFNNDYIKKIGNGLLSINAGFEYVGNNNWGFGFTSRGLSPKVDPFIGINPDAKINSSLNQDALLGFYAKTSYNLNGKYDLSGSFRYDGSSILPKGNQFVPAWGVGAAWQMKKEPFLKNVSKIDKLNLRLSYGVNFNSNGIRQTLGLPFYNLISPDTYRGERTINLVEFYNPDLRVEKTAQWSTALDFGLFNHRVYGVVEFYQKNTSDLLVFAGIPPSNGYNSLLQNVGALRNEGIEIRLSTVNIRTNQFRWTSTFTIAYNKNEVTDLFGKDELKIGLEGFYKVGEAVNNAYVKHWAGVSPLNGEVTYYDENNHLVYNQNAPQSIKFGSYDHPLTGGLTNIFNYKNMEVSTLFTFAYGGVSYNNLKAIMIQKVAVGEVPYAGFLDDIWLNAGDEKPLPYPKLFTDTSANSLFLEDASYIRWKNIILRYDLQEKLKIKGIQSFKITAQSNNILVFSKYQGIDPEVTGLGQPLWRSYTLGFDLTF